MIELPKVKISVRLSEIASFLEMSFLGEDVLLDGFNLSNRNIIADSVISYCANEQYLRIATKNEKVKALIIPESLYKHVDESMKEWLSFIVCDNPEWAFYRAFIHFVEENKYPRYDWKTEKNGATLLPGAIVEDGVFLGKNVVIGSNSVIKSGTIIGNNVTIGACTVIGCDGFQLIKDDMGINHTIPHVGRTYIGNDVSIGDNVTISCSLFEGCTEIGNSVKIDCQVHIGHNCSVGDNSVITANSTMFGSSSIGNNVWISPHCSIMNRVHVGDGSFICACSFVWRDVKPGVKMGGNPAHRIKE